LNYHSISPLNESHEIFYNSFDDAAAAAAAADSTDKRSFYLLLDKYI
jgi:hypothetical protein